MSRGLSDAPFESSAGGERSRVDLDFWILDKKTEFLCKVLFGVALFVSGGTNVVDTAVGVILRNDC